MSGLPLPEGYNLLPATLQDFDSVLRLRITQNITDYGESGLSEASMKRIWFSRDFHVGRDHWVVRGPDGKLAAYGEVRGSPNGQSFQAILATAPGLAPGPDIARVLLDLIEARASEMCARPPCQVTCRVSDGNQGLQRLVEDCGFRRIQTFHVMSVTLFAPPAAAVWPDGITVRTFVPGQDDRAVYEADEEAAQDKGNPRRLSFRAWAQRMGMQTPQFDADLWFLACAGETVVGTALSYYDRYTETAWIDHLGVRLAWRRRGIGTALALYALHAFYDRHYPRARMRVESSALRNSVDLFLNTGFNKVYGSFLYEK